MVSCLLLMSWFFSLFQRQSATTMRLYWLLWVRTRPKRVEKTPSQGARSHGPSISNLWQTKIVPKGRRLHFTEVPTRLVAKSNTIYKTLQKTPFSTSAGPKQTSHIAAFCYNPLPSLRRTRRESIRHPCKTAIWPTPLTS